MKNVIAASVLLLAVFLFPFQAIAADAFCCQWLQFQHDGERAWVSAEVAVATGATGFCRFYKKGPPGSENSLFFWVYGHLESLPLEGKRCLDRDNPLCPLHCVSGRVTSRNSVEFTAGEEGWEPVAEYYACGKCEEKDLPQ